MSSNRLSLSTRPLGGAARCGALKVKGVQTPVCGWADGGSMGIVTWYGSGLEQAAGEFGTIRAAIEHVI